MQESDFRLPATYPGDSTTIFVRTYLPEVAPLRALVQVAHGMAEHSARYARFAKALMVTVYTPTITEDTV